LDLTRKERDIQKNYKTLFDHIGHREKEWPKEDMLLRGMNALAGPVLGFDIGLQKTPTYALRKRLASVVLPQQLTSKILL